jgi:hypothetical protein
MRLLGLLFLVISLSASAAGLANLFKQNSTAPAHSQPQPPKTPATSPALQQATRPQPAPATTPKPPTPAQTVQKQSTTSTTNKSDKDKACSSPTDSTCKK